MLLLNTIISATYVAHYGNQVRNSDAVVATNISGQAKENSSGALSVEEVEDIRNSPQVAGIREDSVVSAMYHDAPGDPVPYAISQAPTDPDLFPYQIQGRMPQNDHEILLPESLRESLHLNIGDKFHGIDPVATVKLPTPTSITNFEGGTLSLEDSLPTKEYTITGTFHSPPLGSEDSITVFAGGTMLTTTSKIAHREHKTNIVHDAHIVAVKLREGVSVEDFKREFTAHHGDHGYVVPAHEYAHKLEPDIGFANDLLTAALLGLAALALMVSAFVITNTFSVLLSQRTREPRSAAYFRSQPPQSSHYSAGRIYGFGSSRSFFRYYTCLRSLGGYHVVGRSYIGFHFFPGPFGSYSASVCCRHLDRRS